jgi:hypothetical protein
MSSVCFVAADGESAAAQPNVTTRTSLVFIGISFARAFVGASGGHIYIYEI